MKVTIEDIKGDGELFTVVWYGDNTPPLLGRRFTRLQSGIFHFFLEAECLTHFATALPPLPRYPKVDDAQLLYRYMAEGLTIWVDQVDKILQNKDTACKWQEGFFYTEWDVICKNRPRREITHCTDKDGNIINVAIKECDDD